MTDPISNQVSRLPPNVGPARTANDKADKVDKADKADKKAVSSHAPAAQNKAAERKSVDSDTLARIRPQQGGSHQGVTQERLLPAEPAPHCRELRRA